MLRGTPTLRTLDGERVLADGEVFACGRGTQSAHQLINNTQEAVRVMIISSKAHADFIEYPDSDKMSAMSGEFGSPDLFSMMLSTESAGSPQTNIRVGNVGFAKSFTRLESACQGQWARADRPARKWVRALLICRI